MISKTSDRYVVVIICLISSLLAAMMIPALVNYQGMGVLVGKIIPLIAVIVLFLFYKSGLTFSVSEFVASARASFQWRYILLVSIAALLCTVILDYLPAGFLPSIFGLISVFGAISSLTLLVLSKKMEAFGVLMLTLPFVRFSELQLVQTRLAGALLGPLVLTPTMILIITFMIVYFLRQLIFERQATLPVAFETKLYLLFAAFCAISTLNSSDVSVSTIGLLVEVVIFPFFFFLVRDVSKESESTLRVFHVIAAYVFLRLFFSFYMAVRGMEAGSLYFAVSQIEVLTTLAGMAIPLALGLLILSKSKFIKCFFLGICVMALGTIVFGDKREPIIALVATLPFVWFLKVGYRRVLITTVLIGVIVALLYYSIMHSTHMHAIPISTEEFMSDNVRLSAWIASLRMIAAYPLLGVGFGQFVNHLDTYAPQVFPFLDIWPLGTPHNFLLHYMTSVGIIAAAVFVVLISRVYIRGIKNLKKITDDRIRNIAVVILWSLSCFLIAANTGGTMVPFAYSKDLLETRIVYFVPDFGILLWLYLGFIVSIYNRGAKLKGQETDIS